MHRTMRRILTAATVVLVAGCAARPEAGTTPRGDGMPVRVTVQNDGTIPTHVRVYLIGGGGAPINLGAMSTLGTETLTGVIPGRGSYQLRAEGGTGYQLTSPMVSLRGRDAIVWDMRRNRVTRGGS